MNPGRLLDERHTASGPQRSADLCRAANNRLFYHCNPVDTAYG